MSDASRMLERLLVRAFARPSGFLGRLGGRVMAQTNLEVYRRVLHVLDVGPRDRVLDVGCGTGQGLALLASRAEEGLVAGVDPSPVMVAQARGHNAAAVSAGIVEVRRARADALPYVDAAFTKVSAVDSVSGWPSVADGLEEVRRVLTRGGRVLLVVRVRDADRRRFRPHGASEADVERLVEALRRAGFADVAVQAHDLGRELVTTLRGTR